MFSFFKKKPKTQIDPDLEYIISNVQYSTSPHEDISFSEDERTFFQALVDQCRTNKINPREIRLTRMESMGFNVDTHDGYIGKINLFTVPDKFAVIKNGGKRATKVFDTKAEADIFLASHDGYFIEIRKSANGHFMQYLIGMKTIKELHDPTLEECIAAIPYWIRHIKYCKRV